MKQTDSNYKQKIFLDKYLENAIFKAEDIMEKLKVGVVIFFIICSVIWAQGINPTPQKAPLCEITIVPVESLFNIKSISITSPTTVYREPNNSSPKLYFAQAGQVLSVFEIKDEWYKISKESGWVQKSKVRVNYNDRFKPIGRILYVADSFLIFYKTNMQYDSRLISNFSVKIPYSEIEKIAIKSSNKFLRAIPGVVIGGLGGYSVGYLLSSQQSTGNDVNDLINVFGQELVGGYCCMGGGIFGGLISTQIMGNKTLTINSQHTNYYKFLLILKKNAIFPFAPPSELQPFLEK
jgi:hypothetical protein